MLQGVGGGVDLQSGVAELVELRLGRQLAGDQPVEHEGQRPAGDEVRAGELELGVEGVGVLAGAR